MREGLVFVAILLFHALVALLRFDGHGGDGARFQTLEADLFAGFFAEAVRAVFNALEGGID